MNRKNYTYWTFIVIIILILMIISSCGQKNTFGITKLQDIVAYDINDSDKNSKVIPDKEFIEAIRLHTKRINNKNMKEAQINKDNKTASKLKLKSQAKVISNLKTLGVINVTARLKGPQAKINTNLIKRIDNKQVFIKRIDGEKDRFGGKMICNTEVLTHRIDRTNFINCLKRQDKLEELSLFNFFVNRNLTSIADVKPEDVKQNCKVTYAVSLHSYHELTECLIHDFEKGGFFKFRNINSLGAKFDIL